MLTFLFWIRNLILTTDKFKFSWCNMRHIPRFNYQETAFSEWHWHRKYIYSILSENKVREIWSKIKHCSAYRTVLCSTLLMNSAPFCTQMTTDFRFFNSSLYLINFDSPPNIWNNLWQGRSFMLPLQNDHGNRWRNRFIAAILFFCLQHWRSSVNELRYGQGLKKWPYVNKELFPPTEGSLLLAWISRFRCVSFL